MSEDESSSYRQRQQKRMKDEVRQQVLEIYRAVDRAVAEAGPVCEASGRCCRFKEWGHVLYLTGLEAEILLEDAPPYEQPVSADFCPFQKDNLCTAREPRPLGCRIYFCDPNYQETGNELTESSLARLRELARENDLDWRYAPLHTYLNEPAGIPPLSPRGGRGAGGEGGQHAARDPDPLTPIPSPPSTGARGEEELPAMGEVRVESGTNLRRLPMVDD